jgi:hypothetical protein
MQQHEDILERSLACSALAAVLQFAELEGDTNSHGAPSTAPDDYFPEHASQHFPC